MSLAPVQILSQEATEERAENARLSIYVGAIAVGDLVKNTLGPKGMDKILVSSRDNSIQVTNDGATILKSIQLDNAAAKILVEISKVQDDEVGDGTTSVCILASELLREAERLIGMKIHPQTIVEGYRTAAKLARDALEASSKDNSKDPTQFKQDLLNVARTTLSSKILAAEKEHFAQMAVDAILRIQSGTENTTVDLDHIQIIKKSGGRLRDSFLSDGFLLDRRMLIPMKVTDARILVANTALDTDKIKVFGSRIKVESTEALAAMERAERDKMKQKIDRIKALGVNCIVNRQLIYSWPAQLLADAGIAVIEHADFDGVERLALVTDAQIASVFDADEVKLGSAALVEEVLIGDVDQSQGQETNCGHMTRFVGVSGKACSVVLRGSSRQILDEAERSIHDALCVLATMVRTEGRVVLGGGCSEMVMAKAIDVYAVNVPGKISMAMESFSRALRQIPTILADNGGFDSAQLVSELRAVHQATGSGLASDSQYSTMGLNLIHGQVADIAVLNITESLKLKRQVLLSAAEAAEMIIRVDAIIKSAPRKRSEHC